jgi:hypothetical protein
MVPELSVVVLCYRSGGAVRSFAARISKTLLDAGIDNYQLVLVGNYVAGSGDTTPDVVRELAAGDPRIVCSAVAKQGMMGWDLRSGLALATGQYLAVRRTARFWSRIRCGFTPMLREQGSIWEDVRQARRWPPAQALSLV